MNDFNLLLEKEIPRLRRYAFALTRNVSRADDLVQDTLVRAIAKQHYWQDGTNLRAWLFTIMHNQNVNVVRSAGWCTGTSGASPSELQGREGLPRRDGAPDRAAVSFGRLCR